MKGKYIRDDNWRKKIQETWSKKHSIIVTGTPRTGVLMPYIGRVFPTQRELARVVGVSPKTITYWLSKGYIGICLN